jgi:uncharacterized membrane protein YjfL (UPF0719 family)
MDVTLVLVGAAKLLFGIMVGVVGITSAVRVAKYFGGFPDVNGALRDNNVAMSVSIAGAIVAMGILVQPAVYGTFSALELLLYAAQHWIEVSWIVAYAIGHVFAALFIGAAIIAIGTQVAIRLTPDVDEINEIRKGNVSCALVLAVILVVLAMLAQEGLKTFLDGFLPLPELGRDTLAAPY